MTLRGVRVTALCEDAAHERWLRVYLHHRGVNLSRHYRALPVTSRGAGEQYVRRQYPTAVQAFRSRAHDRNVALIVATDAARLSVAQRRRTLDDALRASGQAPRADDERIVLLLPRRNVETSVAHLNGASVDEESDYKPQPIETFASASKALPKHCSDSDTGCCPPSLVDGCAELRRLD